MTEKNTNVVVKVDAGKWLGDLRPVWNYIGYDEINYTTTPDGIGALQKIGDFAELPYYVRAHHLLCTGNTLGTFKWGSTNAYIEDEDGNPIYNWDVIDEIFDVYLRTNCKPFVELGFMPEDLMDQGDQPSYRSGGWACPPKDYKKWYDLVFNLVKHSVERYGADEVKTWYWELWNEPDLDYYWKGSMEEFCKLYDYTAAAVKAAFPEARVGGPATTGPFFNNGAKWLDYFLNHCVNGTNYVTGETGTVLDYITFHAKGANYLPNVQARKQLPSIKHLYEQIEHGLQIIAKYPSLDGLEVVLSECDPDGWAAGGRFDNSNLNFRNTEYYASYMAITFKGIMELEKKYHRKINSLTWAFMFEGERCFEGTRSLTTRGIDKPVLNLFRMLALLGNKRLALESSLYQDPLTFKDDYGTEEGPVIDGIATASGNESVEILLYCHHDDWDVQGEYEVEIDVANLPFADSQVKVAHYRIDQSHSNAYAEWVRQGKPNYPAPGQLCAIKKRENLELVEPIQNEILLDGRLKKKFTLPVHGISLLVVSRI